MKTTTINAGNLKSKTQIWKHPAVRQLQWKIVQSEYVVEDFSTEQGRFFNRHELFKWQRMWVKNGLDKARIG